MPALLKLRYFAVCVLVLACAVPGNGQSQTPPSQPWAQTGSDLKPDPALRFGTLPNGMRYVLLHNATPPGEVGLRLRIDAGSLVEKDNQRGLAHFMEHMAFHGTTHLPGTEMIRTLQRLGLSFGADINASTAQDQTIYQLTVPRNDVSSLNTVLYVLREQVSESLMNSKDIDEERGVVEGERRLRVGTAKRAEDAQLAILSPRLLERAPIGDPEVIRAAPRERFVEYYNAYYRPSRATLVAVGDFDVDAMEALIRRNFATWVPRGAAGPDNVAGRFSGTEAPTVKIFQDAGVPDRVTLYWKRAPDLSPASQAKWRRELRRMLGLAAVNQRLDDLANSEAPPFSDAVTGSSDHNRLVGIASFAAGYNTGGLDKALSTIEQEQRRLVKYGITADELNRQITAFRARFREMVATAGTRSTQSLAEELVGDISQRTVTMSPQQQLALFDSTVKGLTAGQVSDDLRTQFIGKPSVFLMTPTTIVGGEKAITNILAASRQVAVSAPVSQAPAKWAYTNFGPPGLVVGRRDIPEIGATLITFANGTTLAVKPTKFKERQVLVGATTGLGELGMPIDRFDPLLGAKSSMVAGGLGKLTAEQMSRALTGRSYSIDARIAPNRFSWSGTTRPEDLLLQTQVVAAYITDSAFRPAPLIREKGSYELAYSHLRNTPVGALQIDGIPLITGDDQRVVIPSPQEFMGLTSDAIRARFKDATAKGPIHVVMVGDVTIDEAIKATAPTFGALPPRGVAPTPLSGADRRPFPAGGNTITKLYHNGDPSQALAYIGWRGPDAVDSRAQDRPAILMASVLNQRVLAEIRVRLGLAYAPGALLKASTVYRDGAYFAVSAETTPDKVGAFFAAVDKIVRDLQSGPVTRDELDRARRPLLEHLRADRATNQYWMEQLTDLPTRPSVVRDIQAAEADLEAVKPADISKLAQQYLKPENAWRATVTPKASAGAAVAPAATPRQGAG